MINAQRHTFFGAGHGIVSAEHANFEQDTTAFAQKAVKLRGAGVIRHWFDNARPSGAPQGDAGVAG